MAKGDLKVQEDFIPKKHTYPWPRSFRITKWSASPCHGLKRMQEFFATLAIASMIRRSSNGTDERKCKLSVNNPSNAK
jgi:hypothetical protein